MARSSDSSLRSARLALALLLAINLFNYIDRYILAAIESRIGDDLLKNDPNALTKLGSLATAFIFSYMITAPIFGWLADRMSRWLLIGLSVLAWSLASGASGLAMSFEMLLITRLFVGVGEGGYGPAAPTLIADLFPLERRGQVMAWFYMAIPVGSALGYGIGGVVADSLGWRTAFFLVVPPGLLLGILCFFMREPQRGLSDKLAAVTAAGAVTGVDAVAPVVPVAPVKHRASLADYLQLLRTPSYVLDCAGMTAMTFAIGGISFWMPRYITEVRHAGTLGHVNLIFGGITAAAGLSATYLGGLAGDLLRPKFPGSYFLVSAIGIFLACPAVIAMLYLPFPTAWIAVAIAEFCLFFNTGPSNTILANVTHPSVRATGFALNILLIHILGDAFSPVALGNIAHRYNWNAAFGVVVAAMVAASIFWLWGIPFLARDTRKVLEATTGLPAPAST